LQFKPDHIMENIIYFKNDSAPNSKSLTIEEVVEYQKSLKMGESHF